MRHTAFTIIEVLVSVIILSLVIWGLFKSQDQNSFNIQSAQKNWSVALMSTPLITQANALEHGKEKSLYDFVQPRFSLRYDPMIKALKEQTLHYMQNEYTYIALSPDSNTTTTTGAASSGQSLFIDKITIRAKEGSISAFAFRLGQ